METVPLEYYNEAAEQFARYNYLAGRYRRMLHAILNFTKDFDSPREKNVIRDFVKRYQKEFDELEEEWWKK